MGRLNTKHSQDQIQNCKLLCICLEFLIGVKYIPLGTKVKILLFTLLSILKTEKETSNALQSSVLSLQEGNLQQKNMMPVIKHCILNSNISYLNLSHHWIHQSSVLKSIIFFKISLLPWPQLATPCSFYSLAHLYRDLSTKCLFFQPLQFDFFINLS